MKHKTRAGDVFDINQMEKSHLLNTIKYMLKVFLEAKSIIDDGSSNKFKQLYFKNDEYKTDAA